MRIAILKAGKASRTTRERWGDMEDLFMDLLGRQGRQWETHDVENGEFPDSPTDYDGYVITGSPASVYDDKPWVKRLLGLIRDIHLAHRPMLGICFGLQAVALALGGEVGPNPKGWEIGLRTLELKEIGRAYPGLASAPQPLRILEVHQDIATRLPEGAVVLASSLRTPFEIFTLSDNVLCLQGHPEMDNEIVRELIEKRHARGLLDKERAEEGLQSLSGLPHRDFFRDWLRDFIQKGKLHDAA